MMFLMFEPHLAGFPHSSSVVLPRFTDICIAYILSQTLTQEQVSYDQNDLLYWQFILI